MEEYVDHASNSKIDSNVTKELDTSWMNEYKGKFIPTYKIKAHWENGWFNEACSEARAMKIYYRRRLSKNFKRKSYSHYQELYYKACVYTRTVFRKARREHAKENGYELTKNLKFPSDSIVNTEIPVYNYDDNYTNTKKKVLSTGAKQYKNGEDIYNWKCNKLQSSIKPSRSKFGKSGNSSNYPFWSDKKCREVFLLKEFCCKMSQRYPDNITFKINIDKVTKQLEETETNFKNMRKELQKVKKENDKLGCTATGNFYLKEQDVFNSKGNTFSSKKLSNLSEEDISGIKSYSVESACQPNKLIIQQPEEEKNAHCNGSDEYFITIRSSFSGDSVKNKDSIQLQPEFIPKLKEQLPHLNEGVDVFNDMKKSSEDHSSFDHSDSFKKDTINSSFPFLFEESTLDKKDLSFDQSDSFKEETINSIIKNDKPYVQDNLKHSKFVDPNEKAIPFPPPPPNIGSQYWSPEQQTINPDNFDSFKYNTCTGNEFQSDPIDKSHKHVATPINQSYYKSNKKADYNFYPRNKLDAERSSFSKMDQQFKFKSSYKSKYDKISEKTQKNLDLPRPYRHANHPNSQYSKNYSHEYFPVNETGSSKEADSPRAFPPPPLLYSKSNYCNTNYYY